MAVYLRTIDGSQVRVGAQKSAIECFRCGLCCEYYQPPVENCEIRALAEGLEVPPDLFASRYVQDTPMGFLLRRTNAGCVFLRREPGSGLASCTVHKFRPDACRDWEAAIEKRECREGLTRIRAKGDLMLPSELYPSEAARTSFASRLRKD